MFQEILHLVGVGEGHLVTGQDQGAAEDGLVELLGQRQGNAVVGNTDADGLALGVHEPPRHLLGSLEDEGVGAGREALDQAVLLVADLGVLGDLGQVAAHQGEVVPVVEAPDSANAVHGLLVPHLAAQRIAGIGGIDDDATGAQDLHRLADEPRLGVIRMYLKELCHRFPC